jgi:hypothetical protein
MQRKTQATDADVAEFLAAIPDEQRADSMPRRSAG